MDVLALQQAKIDTARKLKTPRLRDLPGFRAFPVDMASPPTVAALASASAFTTPTTVFPWEPGAFSFFGARLKVGATFPDTQGFNADTMYSLGTSQSPSQMEFSLDSTDTTGRWEFITKANGAHFRLLRLVNGQWQFVTAGGGATWTASTNTIGLVTEGAPGRYTYRIEGDTNARWFGVNLPNKLDTVHATRGRGFVRVFAGDSFSQPTLNDTSMTPGGYNGFPNMLSFALGGECISAGEGGSGWLTVGTGSPASAMRARLNDVLNLTPDEIWWCLGLNDRAGQTAANVAAEMTYCLTAASAALPSVRHVVVAPFWPRGYNSFGSNMLAIRDAMKAAAAVQPNTIFLDILSMPVDYGSTSAGVPADTALAAQASAGATSISANGSIPLNTYIQIGTGTTAEVRKTSASPTGSGPYTLSFSSGGGVLVNTHSAGETVKVVGPTYMTGTGKQGATAADGNADIYTSNDATHPTVAGHLHIAKTLYHLYSRALSA